LHTACIPLNIRIGTRMLRMANDEHDALFKKGESGVRGRLERMA
jgi:hypothetical protein